MQPLFIRSIHFSLFFNFLIIKKRDFSTFFPHRAPLSTTIRLWCFFSLHFQVFIYSLRISPISATFLRSPAISLCFIFSTRNSSSAFRSVVKCWIVLDHDTSGFSVFWFLGYKRTRMMCGQISHLRA